MGLKLVGDRETGGIRDRMKEFVEVVGNTKKGFRDGIGRIKERSIKVWEVHLMR